jgi:fructose-1,6-bisphosphatase/inositol monophosphatase family enzyme
MQTVSEHDQLRRLLLSLGRYIRAEILAGRAQAETEALAAVAHETASDTIYAIDLVSEAAILAWFAREWPAEFPVELIAEGLEEHAPVTFPVGTPVAETRWKCIIDPIDGTRNFMYDKRSAWVLMGLAPQRGAANTVRDLSVSAMVELPVRKQAWSDEVSAVRGGGVHALSFHTETGLERPLTLRPSRAKDFKHGFASLVKFFPEGKSLISKVEEQLWGELYGLGKLASPVIFDDQYICTGGQFYAIMSGTDRMIGDLRPLVYRYLGYESSLVCHPYDVASALVLEEAGCILEKPEGGPLDAPLDTTSPVAWVTYANADLAELARPVLTRILHAEGLL